MQYPSAPPPLVRNLNQCDMKQLTSFLLILLTACGAAVSDKKLPEAKTTPLETVKEIVEYDISSDYHKISAPGNYEYTHKDEVLKTLEIAEVDTIPSKDFVLVFYRYSIGSEIAHSTTYMKKIDGKYFLYPKYFSSYDDDPFKNGRGIEGKALLKKEEDWKNADKDIWWQ
jgi:hypothetical protein